MVSQVSLIIPIFNRIDLLNNLWDSIVKHTNPLLVREIILINDSPENEAVHTFCESLESTFQDFECRYLKNDVNQGFLLTCNRGFATKQKDTHAVILNTDILLQENWLDKMLNCYKEARNRGLQVSSVTPVTNNGTISTVPWQNNPYEEFKGLNSPKALNRLAERIYEVHQEPIVLPVGVGACFLMTAEAFEAINDFDPDFSPGYGEEVDWCLRALDAGFQSLLDPSTFVYHHGGQSFGPNKIQLIEAHEQLVLDKHPHYHKLVGDFLREGTPFLMHRIFQNYWNVAKDLRSNRQSIHITQHNPFKAVGGIEKFLVDQVRFAKSNDEGSFIIFPENKGQTDFFSIVNENGKLLTRGNIKEILIFLDTIKTCFEIDFQSAYIHHLKFWKHESILKILPFLSKNCPAVSFYVHDYYSISPNYNLLCEHQKTWENKTNSCLQCADDSHEKEHRARFRKYFSYCSTMVFPSETAKTIFGQELDFQFLPQEQFTIPHLQLEWCASKKTLPKPRKRLKLAFLGYDHASKGSEIFFRLAQKYRKQFTFEFIGTSPKLLKHRTMRYRPYDFHFSEGQTVLAQEKPDLVLLLSLCAETFGFTLFEAIEAGVPILTLASSGNIAATVQKWHLGKVFSDENELMQWLEKPVAQRSQEIQLWQERIRHLKVINKSVLFSTPYTELSRTMEGICWIPN